MTALSIPLALLIGFSEECVYRGFFPLLLAAKTGLPLSAIVGISATFCGVRLLPVVSTTAVVGIVPASQTNASTEAPLLMRA